MTNVDKLRQLCGRIVMHRCAYDGEFADLFHIRDDIGRRLIIPLLEDDTIDLACSMVDRRGGAAVLAVMCPDDDPNGGRVTVAFKIATFTATHTADGGDHVPCADSTTLRDLFKLLRPGDHFTIRRGSGDELEFDTLIETELQRDLVGV